jgi:hypothetical protein
MATNHAKIQSTIFFSKLGLISAIILFVFGLNGAIVFDSQRQYLTSELEKNPNFVVVTDDPNPLAKNSDPNNSLGLEVIMGTLGFLSLCIGSASAYDLWKYRKYKQ